MPVIPFYGADDRELFAIERAAMDRQGLVIEALATSLPDEGLVADIGAGDGFTARRLTSATRSVVAMEPAAGMIDLDAGLPWVRGDAAHLPFATSSLDAAYATWAYFFTRNWDPSPGIAELHRVVRPGGPLLIVDNLGDDELEAMADGPLSADTAAWASFGFDCQPIETAFEFTSQMDSTRLLSAFFGPRRDAPLRVQFRVGLFSSRSRGHAT